MKFKGKTTFDVELRFDSNWRGDFVQVMEVESTCRDSIDLERRQAIRVAKAILKKYEPEALK